MIFGAIWLAEAETKTLQDTLTILGSLLGGGLFGMYMVGMLTTRSDGRAILFGIICTLLFTGWTIMAKKGMLPDALTVPFDLYYTGLIGNVVMFVVGYVLGRLFFPSRKPLSNLTIWTHEK
jgi:SSS family solute:Na+ symporter